ncbi:translation initiation factor IF-2 [Candidatus Gracilibacteria bacterium]|nr:MAG: translation initiation factor IF-2 [Candidatus Gracilibacteria bacterium]
MPRIDDVKKDLNLDEATFAKVYEKVMGKKLTAKTATISDSNLEKMKYIIDQLPKKAAKKATPAKKADDGKILKSDEIGFGGGFLSGLGFTKQEEKPEREDEDSLELHNIEIPLTSNKETSQEELSFSDAPKIRNARVIARAEPRPAEPSKKPKSTASKAGGNISIEQGTYKAKEKLQKSGSGLDFFADHLAQKKQHEPKKVEKPVFKKEEKPAPTPTAKVHKEATTSSNLVKKTEVTIEENITVKEFSEKIGVPLPEVMKKLIANGIMTSLNASLDFDTASLIAEDLGVTLKKKEATLDVQSFMEGDLQKILDIDKEAEKQVERAPIVTVMGHVDHGKTSLLDYLRKTSVAGGEAGGITQSIGASMVNYNGKQITFIDTPGHELFTSLRARGAKLTNIAIIVIAADDSVMPQTIESINHAKSAGVPIIIAVTKIDKPGNNMDQIKADVAKYGLTPEDWGGETPFVGVSSKTGQGIDLLLEYVLLQAEMLELKYNPDRQAVGVVVDAYKDPKQGVVASLIVLTGTLKNGDIIVAYNTYGKVRRMQNRLGKNTGKIMGGEPVQILGFTELPEPGRIVEVVSNEKEAHQRIAFIKESEAKASGDGALQQFLAQLKAGDQSKISELRLILKADGSSSLEALKQAVDGLSLPKNVTIKVVHSDVGYFGESDLSLAQASKALLIGFNISMNALLKKKAEGLKIEMKVFDIIYELTDYLNNLLLGMVEVEKEEVIVGKLEILGVFHTETREMTVGGRVKEGKVKNKLKFRVYRGDDILTNGEILSLHRNKDEVKEVNAGEDCGMKVKIGKRIEMGDMLEFYEMQEVKA